MSSFLRTAVAGLGRIAWEYHLPQILANPGLKLSGVVDPLAERRAESQATFGVTPGYATVAELLAAEPLDLLVVATPTHLHREHVVAALAAGVDVLLEKPMAPSFSDASAMADAAARYGRKLMIYQPHRCTASTVLVRDLLRSGRLGELYQIELNIANYVRRNDWQALRQYGGGMLNNFGAHFVDLLLHLTRNDARLESCSLRTIASAGDAEDVVNIILQTPDGVLLKLQINMASALPATYMTLYGSRGTARFSDDGKSVRVRWFEAAELPPPVLQSTLAAAGRAYGNPETIPWRDATLSVADYAAIDFYANVVAYYGGAAAPLVPLTETLSVMRTIAECRRIGGGL